DSPLQGGYTLGSDEGRLKLQELMSMCIKLSKQVLDAQAMEILRIMNGSRDSKDKGRKEQCQDRANVMQLLKWKLHENCGVHTLFIDGTPMEINMLVEKKYPLIKELLENVLNL
ncbi:hypothetical protein Tco_0698549, partial [Tanacetum coccineum]